jgi:hypothetical protein
MIIRWLFESGSNVIFSLIIFFFSLVLWLWQQRMDVEFMRFKKRVKVMGEL